MKKNRFLFGSMLFLGLLVMSSCKKDWTCDCSGFVTTNGVAQPYQYKTPIVNASFSGAKKQCDAMEDNLMNGSASVNNNPGFNIPGLGISTSAKIDCSIQ